MGKIKCTECGQIFDDCLNECPDCGCPANYCVKVIDSDDNIKNTQSECSNHNGSYEDDGKIASHRLVKCNCCGAKIAIDAKRCPLCGAKGVFAPDFGNAIYDCFCRKYFTFSGRSRRCEFFPFLIITTTCFGAIFVLVPSGTTAPAASSALPLITFIPCFSAYVRRLHDVGRSGWWCLVPFVSVYFIFGDSDKTENDYGKSPKYQPDAFTEKLPDYGTEIGIFIILVNIAVTLFCILVIGQAIGEINSNDYIIE